jgi:signal-transduction protein with cAMP-binding, CBS, and nucleotidyltransferase domain
VSREYAPIASRPIRAGAIVRQPARGTLAPVALEDPAVAVMTDLAKVPGVAVDPDVGIEAAMRIMVRRAVRSLFVLGVEGELLGLITATDLLGEKPLRHIHAHGGQRKDILVRDLMTPQSQIEVLSMSDVSRARVGDVLSTLRAMRRQHAMAVEEDASGRQVVRGVFSASQLESQLGTPVSPSVGVRTFAEIRTALDRD